MHRDRPGGQSQRLTSRITLLLLLDSDASVCKYSITILIHTRRTFRIASDVNKDLKAKNQDQDQDCLIDKDKNKDFCHSLSLIANGKVAFISILFIIKYT